jgi:aspartyl-tRNA(Asn)/glutamyl-tRNA(Gln) amidotransferase subunit B
MVACRVKNKKRASNWVMGELVRASKIKKHKGKFPISAESLAELIECLDNGLISNSQAKTVFSEMLESGKSVSTIIKDKRFLHPFNNSELELIVEEMLAENSNEVKKYKEGKRQLLDFFVGLVMKTTKGKANPELVSQLLGKKLT